MDIGVLDQFVDAIKQEPEEKNHTHDAVVSKIDKEGVAWVYVAGSDKETPTAGQSSEVRKGDSVKVEWRNNKLFVAGNYTNPSAGMARVNDAADTAMKAMVDATLAKVAAESAQVDAEVAHAAATDAVGKAAIASEKADEAKQSADDAAESAVEADAKAVAAGQSAAAAQGSANAANGFANAALNQLGMVQDVMGVLQWATEHGTFTLTSDTIIQPGKVYFTYNSAAGDYEPVVSPQESELSTYYELTVDEAMQSFIMAHLAVTARGLWVLPNGKADEYQESTDTEVVAIKIYYERSGSGTAADPYVYTEVVPVGTEDPSEEGWYEALPDEERVLLGIGYKALLTNTGLEIYDDNGVLVSNFGENIEFSSMRNQRIGGPNAFIEYDNASGTLTISGSKVYFSQLDDKVNSLRGDINTELTIVEGDISILQERAEIVDSAVIIDPDEPSVTVVSNPSQVKIKSDAIELKGGANATTFITPNGMETTSLTAREMHPRVNVQGQAIGPFSFIARENGHFSLKKIRS